MFSFLKELLTFLYLVRNDVRTLCPGSLGSRDIFPVRGGVVAAGGGGKAALGGGIAHAPTLLGGGVVFLCIGLGGHRPHRGLHVVLPSVQQQCV